VRILLDTNVFLVSLLAKHKFWWIFQALLDQEYELIVSSQILTEYLEICVSRYELDFSEETLDFLIDLPNVRLVTPAFHWQLIYADPDDDKFVDCAIAGNADFIVTNDRHFNVLKNIPFPRVEILTVDEFQKILLDRRSQDA